MRYDVVVLGLGAMGSAATYQLAKSGARVLGLDRFAPPHTRGSTHGDTRITRRAIGEGLAYVPFVTRSHEIWRELEQQTGLELMRQCGGVVVAPAHRPMHGSADFLASTIGAAQAYGIEHETLGAAELAARLPQFALSGDEAGYFEPGAGFLRPERCIEAQLTLARRLGAAIALGERVLEYADRGDHVAVRTTERTVTADRLVVAAGPWVTDLVPDLAGTMLVYRQVLFWFDLEDRSQYPGYRDLPIYIWWRSRDRDDMVYGFPMIDGPDGGAKIASEQYVETTSPDQVKREVSSDEIEAMFEGHVQGRLTGLGRRCVRAVSCLYTVAPRSRFVIDVHPTMHNVIVASPCSGHGFKHSAAIGECLAQLAITGRSELDLSAFRYPS